MADKFYSIVTTIRKPTPAICELAERLENIDTYEKDLAKGKYNQERITHGDKIACYIDCRCVTPHTLL